MTTFLDAPRLAFRPGRRLFATASVLLLVTAGLHAFGHVQPPAPGSPIETIMEEMRAIRVPMGLGMTPSILDFWNSLSLTMTITLLWLGLQNLATAAGDDARALRRQQWLSVLGSAALTWIYWRYRVLPPLVCLAVVELVFLAALIPRRSAATTDA